MLEAQQQEKLTARQATREFIILRALTRDRDIKEIIEFDELYSEIEEEYLSKINRISEEMENKLVSIEDVKDLVDERIDASRQFKDEVIGINNVPGPLEDFYGLLLKFLDNDISTWLQIKLYYSGFYEEDDNGIKELYRVNSELFRQIGEKKGEIYSKYELGNLI